MKLLIIQCGDCILTNSIKAEANKLIPKPQNVSVMAITLKQVNLPEFKHILAHLQPDTVIIDPPKQSIEVKEQFLGVLDEAIRQMGINNGRIMLISSVIVLGDAAQRTEVAIPFPFNPSGILLEEAEQLLERTTTSHFIMRLPYRIDEYPVSSWLESSHTCGTDIKFNLCRVEEMAPIILDKIQSGWFGKYHVSPNDELLLSSLKGTGSKSKPVDNTLMSKHSWKLSASKKLWDEYINAKSL